MKYDDASWHYDSIKDFLSDEDRLAKSCGHIVAYISSCIKLGLFKPDDIEVCEELERVGNDNKSIEEFFIKWCDCKLVDSDFTKDGNEFTRAYYTQYLDEVDIIAAGCILTKRANEFPQNEITNRIQMQYLNWMETGKLLTDNKRVKWAWWKLW